MSTYPTRANQLAYSSPQPTEPVINLRLQQASTRRQLHYAAAGSNPVLIASQTLAVPTGQVTLVGELELPIQASGLIVFGHCRSSHRLIARSRHVSRLVQQADLGILSIDLVASTEVLSSAGLPLAELTQRLVTLCRWLHRQPELLGLQIGLLGEGQAARATLEAAAQLSPRVGAVVTLGGEGRMADGPQPAPALRLIGARDASLVDWQQIHQSAAAPGTLCVVPHTGATFQESGALAQAIAQATAWFTCYLPKPRTGRGAAL